MRHRTPTPACTPPPPCGLTLVELLVVILIMSIMLAIAVPIVRPPVEARAVREGARMLSTALTSARTRAIQTGRPVGVMFEPSDAAGRTAAVLHYVQVAAPMSGALTLGDGSGTFTHDVPTLVQYAKIPGSESFGGTIKLDYQGHSYPVTLVTSNQLTLGPVDGMLPLRADYKFQFYPPPKKSSLFPLQLPTRAVVDIGASGVGSSGQFSPGSGTPVMVTFTPTGEVDRIYHGDAPAGEELDEPLYLLVGKPGKTQYDQDESDYSSDPDPESTAREVNNLLDGENIWIKVDPRTGAVSSAEIRPMVEQVRIDMVNEDDDPNNDNVDPGIDPPDEPATPPEEQESNLPDIIRKSREFFDGS